MITRGPLIEHLLTATHFWSRVQEIADLYYKGKIKSFEKALGFAEGTFSNWKLGRHKPSFVAFYRFASSLGTTPVRFLTEGVPDAFCAPAAGTYTAKRASVKLTAAEYDRLRSALQAITAKRHSELPMRDIAARLGYRHSFMIYWFRDECRQVSLLHRRWAVIQSEERANVTRKLATRTVKMLYASKRRVTRDLMDRELRNVGLSLQNPIVREAAYAVRDEQLTGNQEPNEE